MDHRNLHSWDVGTEEAREIQRDLRDRVLREVPEGFSPRLVAGLDMSIGRGERKGYAAAVLVDLESMETVEEATAAETVEFPYVPGLLSFREIPALTAAWSCLDRRPDAAIFDGHGYAHPRRLGLACHGGLVFDVPSVGCAKSVLIGEHGELGTRKGSTADIRAGGDGGEGDERVGVALRTREEVRPVYVSVGHRMDLETAVRLVLDASPRYRIPEPVRRADRLVGRLRRSDA